MSGRTLLYLTTVLVALLALAVPGAQAFPGGAQLAQCDTMTPSHGGAQSQAINANVPFTIVPSKSTYYGGERIMVTVNGTTMFKGLLLKAVTSSSSNAVGAFSLVSQDPPLQLLACSNMANSAVTHTNRNLKSAVSVYWTAPMSGVGAVTFRATVVQQFSTFYVGLTSSPLTYMMKMNNNNTTMNTMTTETTMNNNNNNNNMNNNNNNMNTGNKGTVVAGSVAIVLVSMLFSRMP